MTTGPERSSPRPPAAPAPVPKSRFFRAQRMTIVNGILLVVLLFVVLQIWLLTATMNAYLGGDTAVALPAALVSLACLGVDLGLLRYLDRGD